MRDSSSAPKLDSEPTLQAISVPARIMTAAKTDYGSTAARFVAGQ